MNKTILIAGGTAVVSLAAGGAGGYFLAKKKFDAKLITMLDEEVAKTKKYLAIRKMEQDSKPATPEEALRKIEEEKAAQAEEVDDEESPLANPAKRALTDYSGQSTNGKATEGVITNNIFNSRDGGNKRPKQPPRDESGRFLPAQKSEEPQEPDGPVFDPGKNADSEPYIITDEDFLTNDPDHDQENYHLFVKEKTLVRAYDREVVDLAEIGGEDMLGFFPTVPKGEKSALYIRNDGLGKDYDVMLDHTSLGSFVGFGGDEEDEEAARYV